MQERHSQGSAPLFVGKVDGGASLEKFESEELVVLEQAGEEDGFTVFVGLVEGDSS